jgi:hypothetical protein
MHWPGLACPCMLCVSSLRTFQWLLIAKRRIYDHPMSTQHLSLPKWSLAARFYLQHLGTVMHLMRYPWPRASSIVVPRLDSLGKDSQALQTTFSFLCRLVFPNCGTFNHSRFILEGGKILPRYLCSHFLFYDGLVKLYSRPLLLLLCLRAGPRTEQSHPLLIPKAFWFDAGVCCYDDQTSNLFRPCLKPSIRPYI